MREGKPLLLIAEDDPDDQLLIQDAIDETCSPDLETFFVLDGVELLKFLHEKAQGPAKPGLVLLDLNMPRMDGRAALQEIKADPDLASIPIVIFTTSSSDLDVQYCQRYGVDGYYRKPNSITELREIMGQLCKNYLN
jgi:CheY-like chemotaxis protein